MCVIFVCRETRATEEMVDQAWKANDHGGGAAWRILDKQTNEPLVSWQKGCTLEEMFEVAATKPLPHVLHFRIASCGGKLQRLTHPFPISEEVPLWLSGVTPGPVLFHNGHWTEYRTAMRDLAIKGAFKIPSGKWSDSRALAWFASKIGLGFLEFMEGQRIVAFGPEPNGEIDLYGDGWSTINDVICSNTHWERKWVQVGRRAETGLKSARESATVFLPDDEAGPPNIALENGEVVSKEDLIDDAGLFMPTGVVDPFRRSLADLNAVRSTSHQVARGPSTVSPFGPKPSGSGKHRKGQAKDQVKAKDRTNSPWLYLTWKDIGSMAEAQMLLAEELISKSQYKKYINQRNQQNTKAWKAEQAEMRKAAQQGQTAVQTATGVRSDHLIIH